MDGGLSPPTHCLFLEGCAQDRSEGLGIGDSCTTDDDRDRGHDLVHPGHCSAGDDGADSHDGHDRGSKDIVDDGVQLIPGSTRGRRGHGEYFGRVEETNHQSRKESPNNRREIPMIKFLVH